VSADRTSETGAGETGRTLEQILAELSPEARARVEKRAAELRAEEGARQARRALRRKRPKA
jgi:hypothetical protein